MLDLTDVYKPCIKNKKEKLKVPSIRENPLFPLFVKKVKNAYMGNHTIVVNDTVSKRVFKVKSYNVLVYTDIQDGFINERQFDSVESLTEELLYCGLPRKLSTRNLSLNDLKVSNNDVPRKRTHHKPKKKARYLSKRKSKKGGR